MNKKLCSAGRKLLSLVLCMTFPATAVLADTWDLGNGQISVNATEESQTVTQYQQDKTVTQADANPVITGNYGGCQSDTDIGAAITMSSSENSTAKITLDNAFIETDSTGIDVKGSSNAHINVHNTRENITEPMEDVPENGLSMIETDDSAIHVTNGSLTIDGGNPGTFAENQKNEYDMPVDLYVASYNSTGIGSQRGETMSGNITVQGDVTLSAMSYDGHASIGSGSGESLKRGKTEKSEMSGNITITEKADVIVIHDAGAGLGSGAGSQMSGNIQVTGNSMVIEGDSEHIGASIGSGVDENRHFAYDALKAAPTSKNIPPQNTPGFTGQITIGQDTQIDCMDLAGKKSLTSEEQGTVTIGNGPSISMDALAAVGRGDKKEAPDEILADGTKGSITIERGATIEKTNIQSHQDADPYLNCYIQTGKDDPVTMDHINVYIVDGAQPSQPDKAAVQNGTHYYWVTADGMSVPYTSDTKGDVLYITTEKKDAELHCSVYGLNLLLQQGIQSVVFRTDSLESSFFTAETAKGHSGGTHLVLSHKGGSASMAIGSEDISDLLR